jgi:mannose-6-phosphate isomerase-like protein (cupin superfamily)
MRSIELKNIEKPDETRNLPKTKIDVVNFEDVSIMRATFQPGWKWSECIKPTVGTNSCQVEHVIYVLSGRMHIAMDDGASKEIGPGDIVVISPGHDAWVVGNEPCVTLDIVAGIIYGKKTNIDPDALSE